MSSQSPCYKYRTRRQTPSRGGADDTTQTHHTHMYRGPSVVGYRCVPNTDPHCPMAMNMGIPVARFVSDPRLCANQAMTMPMAVYVPHVMQKTAK